MSPAVRVRRRPAVPALLLAVGLALAGCGSTAAAEDENAGHGHGSAATVEGPEDRYAGVDLPEPYRRPSFTLTDTTGAEFDFTDRTGGRPTLLFFGYTNCPDVCPATMADIAVAMRGMEPAVAEQVQVVFVTTDPAFDSPAVLGEYLDRFDADLPTQFIGLTGEQELIDQAQLSAGVPLAEDDGRLHSSLLLLYGSDDEAPVAFDAGNTARDIAADLTLVVAGVVTRLLARLAVVLLGLLGTLAVAGPASAHVGGGAAGSDFDGRIVSVSPEVPGVTVRILQFGDEFELVNETSTDVLVPGYSDEPYLRIGPDGVWRNANSPATYLNLDRFGNAQPPARADASAEPDWQQVSTEPRYVWHDHRTHWMSQNQLPPAVQADPTKQHTVAEWTVPLRHGDTEVAVAGVLTWTPPPAPEVTWPVYAALALLVAAAGLFARTPRPLGALMALGAVAALWHALATPEPPSSLGSQTGAIVAALLPAVTAVLVAVVGVRAAWRGRGAMAGLMAVVLGWLFMVQGLPDVDVLWSANVASNGPEIVARVAVTVLVTFGVGLVLGGIAAVRRFRESDAHRKGADTPAPVPVS